MQTAIRSVVALALLSGLAAAQPKPAVPPANDLEAAKAHFAAGNAYYEQAAYQDALKEFNEAFRLSRRTDLLYNIAVCYERLGRLDDAVAALRRYLEERPGAPDRAIIESRIASLERQKTAPPPGPEGTKPATTTTVTAHPAAPASDARWWVNGTAVGAVGVVLLVGALGTGLGANNIHGELVTQCAPFGDTLLCPDNLRSRADTGRALAIATDVLAAVGGAALLTGVVLLIVDSRRGRRATPGRVGAVAGGVGVRF